MFRGQSLEKLDNTIIFVITFTNKIVLKRYYLLSIYSTLRTMVATLHQFSSLMITRNTSLMLTRTVALDPLIKWKKKTHIYKITSKLLVESCCWGGQSLNWNPALPISKIPCPKPLCYHNGAMSLFWCILKRMRFVCLTRVTIHSDYQPLHCLFSRDTEYLTVEKITLLRSICQPE